MSAPTAEERYKPNETKMMAAVIQSFKDGPPENSLIDFEKVAVKVGMTTGSARETWRKLRNKLAAEDDGNGDGNNTVAGTGTLAAKVNGGKKATAGSKRKKAADAEGNDNDTPTKPKRGRKKKDAGGSDVKTGVSGEDAGEKSGYVEATSLKMGNGGQDGQEAGDFI